MSDLFSYHVTQQQLADLRRTADQDRLARSTQNREATRRKRQRVHRFTARLAARSSAPRVEEETSVRATS